MARIANKGLSKDGKNTWIMVSEQRIIGKNALGNVLETVSGFITQEGNLLDKVTIGDDFAGAFGTKMIGREPNGRKVYEFTPELI